MEAVKLETAEQLREAIGVLAVELTRHQERIALLVALVDIHQAALEARGIVKRKTVALDA